MSEEGGVVVSMFMSLLAWLLKGIHRRRNSKWLGLGATLALVLLAILFFAPCCGSVGSGFWKLLNTLASDVQMLPGELTEPPEDWDPPETCPCCREEELTPLTM